MNILVIGGAGYIGSHVAREFLDAGHSVTVYDNLSSGQSLNVFTDEVFIKGDILDDGALRGAMREGRFDALVHLAAFKAAGESMLVPEKYSLNNLNGTVNILNAALECGIRYVVFSSSAAVYGEPQYLPVDENHPKNPSNYYGFTKLEIERVMAWYAKLKGMRFAVLRYFNAAGYDIKGRVKGLERNPANLLPIVLEAAAGLRKELCIFGNDYDTQDGTCIRDYIHVSDLAAGHLAALKYIVENHKSLTLNLGSEAGLSVLEIASAAKKITGINFKTVIAPRRAGDPSKLTASARLAFETLGWKARYSDADTLIQSMWKLYELVGSCGSNKK